MTTGPKELRTAVFGYRLRFAPEIQPLRQTVIDHVILRALIDSWGPEGQSVGKLTALDLRGVRVLTFSMDETHASLARLERAALVERFKHRKKNRWRVTDVGRETIAKDESLAKDHIHNVVQALFGGCSPIDDYRVALLQCLSEIFDRLAQNYVESTFTDSGRASPLTPQSVERFIKDVLREYPSVDPELFESAVLRFLRESTPDFDWLKWTYCKNSYSVRAIGIGHDSDLLSRTVFSGTAFYLDTNILISALDVSEPNHNAVTHVIAALQRIDCDVKVLTVTVAELNEFAARQGQNLDSTLKQIPDALISRVRGVVARAEARHRADPTQPLAADVLKPFMQEHSLRERLGLEVVHDDEFDRLANSEELKELAVALKKHYDESPPFGRSKTQAAALHDAQVLRWMTSHDTKATFLTLDASLPTFRLNRRSPGVVPNVAVTLHALIPWLGAISETDDASSKAYSALLANQLVLMRQTFSIQEFRMLAEIGLDCGKMPAEDVEQCLLYLRREARGIDVGNAEGREKLHHIVKGFFASPDRRYIAELSELRNAIEERERELADAHAQREAFELANKSTIERYKQESTRARATTRLIIAAFLFLGLTGASVWIAMTFGDGQNVWMKVGSMWWLFGLTTGVAAVSIRVLCRGELWPEAKAMLWPLGYD